MKKQFYFTLIIFISLFIFGAHNAEAANVSITASANAGNNLDVVVSADTGGVLINSAEAVINYDPSLLLWNGYSDDNSVIKLWINPPNAQNGQISFSGIIPGGVNGLYDASKKGLSPLPLVHLLFTIKSAGTASFSFADSKILENDGAGTPLAHDNVSASVDVRNNPNNTVVQNPPPNTNTVNPNNSNPNLSVMPDRPDPLFWLVISLLIAGFLVYKLLKYKT